MKAIHNCFVTYFIIIEAVFKEQSYDKWKQFTTSEEEGQFVDLLFSKSKVTINESNSQLPNLHAAFISAVFKEQSYDKWKQFTTCVYFGSCPYSLFSKSKVTINESNSQLVCVLDLYCFAVFKEQSYDKWKQFTTSHASISHALCCFQRAKLR